MNTKLISIVVGLILVISIGSFVYLNKKQANNATMYESASSSSAVATSTSVLPEITLAQVATHNSRTNCWSAINGSVYDLTSWIPNHPGGEGAITGLCGIDGSIRYNSQHGGKSKPAMALAGFKVGVLAK